MREIVTFGALSSLAPPVPDAAFLALAGQFLLAPSWRAVEPSKHFHPLEHWRLLLRLNIML